MVGCPQTHFSRGIAYCRLIFTGTEARAVCGRITGVAAVAAATITGVAADRTDCTLLERPQHMSRPILVDVRSHYFLLLDRRLLCCSNRVDHLLCSYDPHLTIVTATCHDTVILLGCLRFMAFGVTPTTQNTQSITFAK